MARLHYFYPARTRVPFRVAASPRDVEMDPRDTLIGPAPCDRDVEMAGRSGEILLEWAGRAIQMPERLLEFRVGYDRSV